MQINKTPHGGAYRAVQPHQGAFPPQQSDHCCLCDALQLLQQIQVTLNTMLPTVKDSWQGPKAMRSLL